MTAHPSLRRTRSGQIVRIIVGLAFLSLLPGCGGGTSSDGGQQPPPGSIGVAGGTVGSSDGNVSLAIPQNSVTVATVFTIAPSTGTAPPANAVGTVYDIEPTGTAFASNALPQLTIDYGVLPNGVDPATLTIGTLTNGQWVDVPGSLVNQANHTVTAPLQHLSPYAVLHPSSDPNPTDNHPPVIITLTVPPTGTANQPVAFSGAASDDDGDILTYTWNFGDGSPLQSNPNGMASHAYTIAASYTVTLTVTDGHGGMATSNPQPIAIATPVINLAPSASVDGPYMATTGQTIPMSAAGSSDPNNDPLTYRWTFGDGAVSSPVATPASTHLYGTEGTYTVTVSVTDPAGLSSSATTTATINPAPVVNHLPVITNMIMPTPSTVIAGQSFTVTATVSDQDVSDAITYSWNFGDGSSGTPVSLSPAAAHTYTNVGSYTVTLTVSDGHGVPVSDTRVLTVSAPPNRAPVANAGGPYTGIVNQVLTFNAAASTDPDGTALTYRWSFGDGTSTATIASPTTLHAYGSTTGSPYTVTLTVTDPAGLSSTATTTATITPPVNRPPVANAGGPYAGTVGQVLTFNASASSDPDVNLLTYAWNFGDGITGAGVTTTHAYSSAATYTVTVTVTDSAGASTNASTTATITLSGNRPPVANAGGPYAGVTGEVLTLSAVGSSDPDVGDTLTYTWNFGDTTPTVSGISVTHAYSSAATYAVTVTVADPSGASNTATTTATISTATSGNSPPTVTVTVPPQGLVMENMVLRGAGSDPDVGDTLTYRWDFGDGASTAFGAAASLVHEYAQAGTYVATLTVSDGQGHTVAASGSVTITLSTRPVAFPQSLAILKRYINSASYLYWIAFELDGAGAPPLRFNIVTYPAHWAAVAQTLGVTAGVNYQWWNPITNTRRPECFTTASLPLSCKATYSSVVDTTSGALTMTPSTAPPTVAYLPESCWNWSGLSDSFTFTVTDGNGGTSDPAVVAITMNGGICQPPN